MTQILHPRLVNIIAIVVTVLWVANFAGRLLVTDYDPSPAVDAAMTLVLGAALGSQFIRARNGRSDG
jgi:hypothetical protein